MIATALGGYPEGDHTDHERRGLQLRVRKSSRTWLLRYRWREEFVRIVLGHWPAMSLADAREKARALRQSITDGIDPRRAMPRRAPAPTADLGDTHSVDFLVAEFTARKLRGRKRPEAAKAMLERDVLPEWTGRDAR